MIIPGPPVHKPPPGEPIGHGGGIHLPPPITVYAVSIGTFPPSAQDFQSLDQALTYVRSHFQTKDHTVTITVRQLFGA